MTNITDTAPDRLNAFAQLGQQVVGKTAEAVLEEAGLAGWNVRKSPVTLTATLPDGKVTKMEVPGKFANVRDLGDGEIGYLGMVGNHYHPVQNEDLTELMQAITDESGAVFDAAGSIQGGKRVFVSMKLPDTMQVGGLDPVDTYLTLFNSHDGQSSFSFVVTPIRTWCANMQAVATREALSGYKVRHTAQGASARIQEARETLDLTFRYVADFQKEAEALIDQAYTDNQFARLTSTLFPTNKSASPAVQDRQAAHRGALADLFHESPTSANIRGTRWAAFQAVTEYTDHIITKAGKAGDVLRDKRASDSIDPRSAVSKLKERAFATLTK